MDSEGTLSISGTGAIPDYTASSIPWYSQRDNIIKVVIGDGITAIGTRAFSTCKKITSVTVPNSVLSIGEYAFANDEGLTKLTLGNKLQTISPYAFYNCKGLTSVSIPDSVVTLGDNAFISCSSLTTLVIGAGLKVIGASAFHSCAKLSNLTIGSGVTEVGTSAFHNCTALKNVTYLGTQLQWSKITINSQNDALTKATVQVAPDNTCGNNATWSLDSDGTLTISGEGPMGNYTAYSAPWIDLRNDIKKVVLEEGITSAGTWAFYMLPNLTEVVLPETLTRIEFRAFSTCKALTEITIPDSVTLIGDRAFANDEKLESVHLGYNVKTIEVRAFYNCISLKNIDIPNSVVTLGEESFNTCTSMTEVTIGSGVTTIEDSAFRNCTSLEKVTIGGAVTTIAGNVFRGCSALKDVYYRGTEQKWASIAIGSNNTELTGATFHFATANTCGDNLTWSLDDDGTLTISGTGKMDDYEARTMPWYSQRSNVKKVVIEDGVTNVGTWAFYNHPNLVEVSLGNSVKTIGVRAFASCKAIASIDLGDTVTLVEDFAFASCEGATEIIFGANLKTVGDSAFYNCKGLTELVVPASVTSWGDRAFTSCTGLAKVTLEDGITTASVSMFHGCNSLTTLTLPETVTVISDAAFRDCSALTDIYYMGSEEQWNEISLGIQNTALESANMHFACEEGVCGENLVWYLDAAGILTISGTGDMYDYSAEAQPWADDADSIQSVVITNGVSSIGNGAFSALGSLEEVTIPESVVAIGDSAFFGCVSLTTIIVAEENSAYCAVENVLFDKNQTVLMQYAPGKQEAAYVIPETVMTIGKGAFASSAVEEITVPNRVIMIEENAFASCNALTKVYYDGFPSVWNEIASAAAGNEALLSATVSCSWNEGTCGEQVIWQLDSAGTLTISGTGAMADYELRKAPWYSLRNNIQKVVICDGVTAVGVGAFFECSNVTDVTFGNDLESIGDRAFGSCKGITEIALPESVISVGDFAFASCEGLNKLTLGETLETIGASAFYNCINLIQINIPNSVTSLGERAFNSCTALTDVMIGNGLTTINPYVFHNCFSLVNLTLPETVTTIGDSAFDLCTKLKTVYYYGTEADWNNMEIGDKNDGIRNASIHYFSGSCGDNLTWRVTSDGVLTLEGTGDMYDYTAYTMPWYDHIENIRKVIIGDGVTGLGNSAFQEAANLTEVIWGESLQTIGERAFSACVGLETITLPETVTTICDHAFAKCSNLAKITFAQDVSTVGQYAFFMDSKLTDIYYYGEPDQWSNISVGNYNDYFTAATVHFVPVIKTQVSQDSKTFTVRTLNVENGKTVILALYYGNKLVEVQLAASAENDITFTTTKEYTTEQKAQSGEPTTEYTCAKVMVWEDPFDSDNQATDEEEGCNFETIQTKYQVEIVK
ncbi:MAG: leucine-rich repeat domain-containing protein [Clostridia bacterium]|nr:leucine-rich repeat domain-containing protein [Clostridia bacterium]